MTGFGSAKAAKLFLFEIASYNGKRLDIFFDAPQALFSFEMALRKKIEARLERGSVKLRVRLCDRPKENLVILKEKMEALAKDLGYAEALSFSELLTMMNRQEEFDPSWEEPLLSALEKALDELIAFREREGEVLREELLGYHKKLAGELETLAKLAVQVRGEIQVEIEKKLKELAIDCEESRLLQEAFFLAEKRDVSEELSRLSAHFTQLEKLLKSNEPQGKMLTFLLQEIMRELNTTCAKKPSGEIVAIALGMKGTAEKMREQVLNVE